MKPTWILLPLAIATAEAAVLTPLSFNAISGTTNLPSGTGTDWGYFDPGTGAVSSLNATNSSSVAGGRTFTVTAAGTGTQVRGSSADSDNVFTFSNGESPTTGGAGLKFGGVFNSTLGTTGIGSGVQMTLNSFTSPATILLYTYEWQSGGTLSVYVDGNSTAAYSQAVSGNSSKDGHVFAFDFIPDSTSSSVRFEYLMTSVVPVDAGTANLGFQAIAIVPEPTSIAMLSLIGIPAIFRRRR